MSDIVQGPIFIAGPGRSGTTLLRSLLSAHSRICIAPETHFMTRVAEVAGGPGVPSAGEFETFWDLYTSQTRFKDLGVEKERCRAILEKRGATTFRDMFAALLLAYQERVGKERVGEKTPGHERYIPELLDWFPDARILVLRRDPRAVISSQLRSLWVQRRLTPFSVRHGLIVGKRLHQVAFYAHDWWEVHERIMPSLRSDPRVRTVPYEALVSDPEAELREVCEFLGETFQESMLEERSPEDVPPPASELWDTDWGEWRQHHHARARRPVSADSLDKWKEALSGWEVALVEGRCEQGMRAAGYDLSASVARRLPGRVGGRTLLAAERAEDRSRTVAKRTLRPVRDRLEPLLSAFGRR